MDLSLSKGGLPTSIRSRAWQYYQIAWRGATNEKALSHLAALSPLLLLDVGQMANATNLLTRDGDDMKATFDADSFVMMYIIIAELIISMAMYIRTKSLLILLGLVVVIVFTTVGLIFISRYGGKRFRQIPLPENPVGAEPYYWATP